MKKDLLLIIDMQNVYAEGGLWCCPGMEQAAVRVKELLATDKVRETADVIFTRFLAAENPVGVWADYNAENAEVNADPYANEMHEIFRQEVEQYPLYTKSTYSSLTIPEVMDASLQAGRVVVAGVVAECCVLATVMALIDAGVSVVYLTDGVAGVSHKAEEAVELVLSGLEPLHVRRMTVNEYLSE